MNSKTWLLIRDWIILEQWHVYMNCTHLVFAHAEHVNLIDDIRAIEKNAVVLLKGFKYRYIDLVVNIEKTST